MTKQGILSITIKAKMVEWSGSNGAKLTVDTYGRTSGNTAIQRVTINGDDFKAKAKNLPLRQSKSPI